MEPMDHNRSGIVHYSTPSAATVRSTLARIRKIHDESNQ